MTIRGRIIEVDFLRFALPSLSLMNGGPRRAARGRPRPAFVRLAVLAALSVAAQVSASEDRAPDPGASSRPAETRRADPGPSAVGDVISIEEWRDPARDVRPVARWWWPGGSVDPVVMRSQLRQIREAGFGAVEVQPLLLGLGAADLAADPRVRSVGQASFRSSVASAAATAAELGLDFDLTLGSGWPGGLPTGKENAERQLLMASVDIAGPVRFRGPLPEPPDPSYRRKVEWVLDVLGPPDPDVERLAVLAARLGAERDGVPTLEDVRVLSAAGETHRIDWAVPAGSWRIFTFYENSTGHFVMGGAFPGAEADALVVDPLSQRGADALLDGYAAPLLDSLPPGGVREIFVDSFELMGELPFTRGLLEAFEAHAGYALTPHLPFLFRRGGESKYGEMLDLLGRGGGPLYLAPEVGRATRIREDYEAVRAILFETRFIERIRRWAHDRGVALRLQAHGGYGGYLDIYARADVPESEGLFAGGAFDFLKLAASAAHVAGRRFVSSESFVSMTLDFAALKIEDYYLLAGNAYAAGINRTICHGYAYHYPIGGERAAD